jgi:hypothetical protein
MCCLPDVVRRTGSLNRKCVKSLFKDMQSILISDTYKKLFYSRIEINFTRIQNCDIYSDTSANEDNSFRDHIR